MTLLPYLTEHLQDWEIIIPISDYNDNSTHQSSKPHTAWTWCTWETGTWKFVDLPLNVKATGYTKSNI